MNFISFEFYIILSTITAFWVYLIQSAELFAAPRNKVKTFLAKRMAGSKKIWLWKFPNHWLHCPFCLSFWMAIPMAIFMTDIWLPMIIPVMVNIINKLGFNS